MEPFYWLKKFKDINVKIDQIRSMHKYFNIKLYTWFLFR